MNQQDEKICEEIASEILDEADILRKKLYDVITASKPCWQTTFASLEALASSTGMVIAHGAAGEDAIPTIAAWFALRLRAWIRTYKSDLRDPEIRDQDIKLSSDSLH